MGDYAYGADFGGLGNDGASTGPSYAPSPFFGLAPSPSPLPPIRNTTSIMDAEPVQAEVFASLSILLQILLLGLSFVVGHILRRRKFYYIHEASAAILIGAFLVTRL